MEWLTELFTGENGPGIQLVAVTLSLMVLLIIIVWIVRKIAGTGQPKGARGRVKRLSVSDIARVDEKRFLVLVRRDNVEHLVMIGGPTDVVVESSIVRVEPVGTRQANGKTGTKPAASATTIPEQQQPAAEPQPKPAKPPQPKQKPAPVTQKTSKPGETASPASASSAKVAAIAATAGAAIASATTKGVDRAEASGTEAASRVMEHTKTALENAGKSPGKPSGKSEVTPANEGSDDIADIGDSLQSELEEALKLDKTQAPASPNNGSDGASRDIGPAAPEVVTGEVAKAETGSSSANSTNTDDEIQRLLNELSGEKA